MLKAVVGLLVATPFLLGVTSADAGPQRHELFRFADPAIVESSGLVVVPGAFVTVNDSGDSARVFSVDPRTGRTVGVTRWAGEAIDDEALAPSADPGFVWVGDLGDNTASRDSVSVIEVPVGGGQRTVQGKRYTLTYPHGGATDAETLLCDPRTGRLFVVTKGVFGGVVYAAPATLHADRPNPLRPRGRALGIATDGAFFPDGRHVIIRDYSRAVVYTWPSLHGIASIRLPRQRQGEGIAVDAGSRVYVSSEGLHQPVYRVTLPASVQSVVGPQPAPPSSSARPAPYSRDGREVPEQTPTDRSPWQWLLGTIVLVGAFAVLVRALRPR